MLVASSQGPFFGIVAKCGDSGSKSSSPFFVRFYGPEKCLFIFKDSLYYGSTLPLRRHTRVKWGTNSATSLRWSGQTGQNRSFRFATMPPSSASPLQFGCFCKLLNTPKHIGQL